MSEKGALKNKKIEVKNIIKLMQGGKDYVWIRF